MGSVLHRLFLVNCKIGFLAFGGGNTAIPLLEAEVVPHWVTREEFLDLVGVNFAVPGISVIKLTAMIGLRTAGLPGLLAAVIGLLIPGLVLTLAVYSLLGRFRELPAVGRLLNGLHYAAAGVLAASAFTIAGGGDGKWSWVGMAVAAGVFAAVHFVHVSPALAILGAGVVGLLLL